MPLHVPSKLIIFVSTIVSSCISLLAGYLLYAESISVLRSAVEESSAAASKSARLRLAGMLDDVKATTHEGILSFSRDDIMNVSLGMKHVNDIYTSQAFASLRSTEYGYGTGYFMAKTQYGSNASCTGCVPPWEDPEGYGRQSVWYDPILDSDGNEAKYWLSEYVVGDTVIEGVPSFDPITKEHKKFYTAMNNDTGVYAPDVIHSHSIEDVKGLMTWMQVETPYNGTWSPTYFWNAVDGSPYAYNAYRVRYSLPWADGRYNLVMMGFFMFRPWTAVVREFETANTELVALDPYLGQVFAHTIYNGPAIRFECYTICFSCADFAGQDCMMHPNDLGPTVSGAVNSSKVRPRGTFFTADLSSTSMRIHIRYGEYFAASDVNKTTPLYKKDYFVDTSLDGGEYFLRLTHVYTAAGTTFELLWMRSVSSVNDKVYAALVQLIIASVVIFVVDIIIAVLEVTLIARPLEKLVVGNQYLETMDLDGAEAHMNAMYKPVMVQEVARVTDGLLMAIKGLREYKAYLPNTLFVEESDELSESCASSLGTKNSKVKSRSSKVTMMSERTKLSKGGVAGQNLSMQMQNYKGTAVRLVFPPHLYHTFPNDYAALVEVVQEAVQSTKGLAHGFAVYDPLAFTLTWNVGLRCAESVLRSIKFCKLIAVSDRVLGIATPIMSVAQGTFQAGNLGSATQKGFGMKGPALLELRAVSAIADAIVSTLPAPTILVGPLITESISGRFMVTAVTLLKLEGTKNPILISEVGHAVETKEEEWMYQLQDAVTEDPLVVAFASSLHPGALPNVPEIQNPTNLQSWSLNNIRENRAVMNFTQAATW